MKIAIFAGSFDPLTNGHLNIIQRASMLFDKVIVLLAINPDKHYRLSLATRLSILRDCVSSFNNVSVDFTNGLTVDYAKTHNAKFLVRGLRNRNDFEYEFNMAKLNLKLNNDIQTVFFMADKNNSMISSTDVVELYKKGTDVSSLVPYVVFCKLNEII